MRTKYVLHIDGVEYELTSSSVYNWDEILCSYSRKDHNGVVRAFSTNFEFVGLAYDVLLNLYLTKGVNAEAVLSVLTLKNDWTWEERFSAPLDFSTISWDGLILSIFAIDNSLAAMIASRGKTKYEFTVGNDITPLTLKYDRIKLANTITHEIMGDGVDKTFGAYIDIYSGSLHSLPVFSVGSGETFDGSPVFFDDQTDENGSFFLEAVDEIESLDLYLEIEQKSRRNLQFVRDANIYLKKFRKGSSTYETVSTVFHYQDVDPNRTFLGTFSSSEQLKSQYPDPAQNVYALVNTSYGSLTVPQMYYTPVGDVDEVEWLAGDFGYGEPAFGEMTDMLCVSAKYVKKIHLTSVPKGTCFALFCEMDARSEYNGGRQEPPLILVKSRIKSSWNSRGKTIDVDVLSPESVLTALIDKITEGKLITEITISDQDPRLAHTYLAGGESIRAIPGAKFYTSFDNFCGWMSTVFGYTYRISERISDEGETIHQLHFLHRSEIFGSSDVVEITDCKEFNYDVDTNIIYNTVEAGYRKQEYDAECGRDEWNFTNHYTTGTTVLNSKLSLISEYRADCYGIEFLAQKRTRDTTDDKADNSVFFIHCKYDTTEGNHPQSLVINREDVITGVLSDTVFNGCYSPRQCVEANAGYIAAMGIPLQLNFASGEGNTDIKINGKTECSDIILDSQLFTCGTVSFKTDYIAFPSDPDTLIRIKNAGLTYTGFISSLKLKYAKAEAAGYELIVKSIEP